MSVDVPEVPATARGRMPQWKLSVRKKMYELKGKLDERHPESMTLQVLGAAMGFLEALPEELLVVQQRLQVDSPLTPQGMLPVALLKRGCSTVLPDDLCVQDEVLQVAAMGRVERKSFTAFEAKLLMLFANGNRP